ncbi:hypothetical protein SAMN05660662_2672 [Blastococcus aurantiacus]|uniref:Uncharacterized protein n=1 Tax=Blastococcus aurantiacus TaxID=1550231 RepID=A0A1G7MGH5_9ACTN|nr:DUF5677 domain-containing protein [Blastococcus aurantiacus]SDF60249.1 hypothetical protein SAMN05660662_2672 [Blastococcus aurantiacus]
MADIADVSTSASLDRVDRLLRHWERAQQDDVALRIRGHVEPAHGLALWGLTCHVYEQTRLVRPLIESHGGIELAPMIRSLYENALMAQWLVQRGPKALPGFLKVGARQRFYLAKTMHEASWTGMTDEIVQRLENGIPEEGELAAQAKHFEKILGDFGSGRLMYAVYRYLSGLSHPGITLVDAYAHMDAAGNVSLRREAEVHDAGTWAWTTVWALVWSRGALDSLTDASPARHFLKGMAREAGMPGYTLKLTKEAAAKAYADRYEAGRPRRRTAKD